MQFQRQIEEMFLLDYKKHKVESAPLISRMQES